jgi:general secretion pathway protein I
MKRDGSACRQRYHKKRIMDLLPKKIAGDGKGFTLLEVMIALAVIAVVLVSVFRMGAQTISMSADARFYAVAPLLAQEKLAGLADISQALPYEETGDFGDAPPGYFWQARIEPVDLDAGKGGDAPLKRIDVSVTMENSEVVFQLRSYRVR